MIKVDFDLLGEYVFDGDWTGPEADFLIVLNAYTNQEGPSPADPDPLLHEAERVIELIGFGEIVEYEKPEGVEGRVY